MGAEVSAFYASFCGSMGGFAEDLNTTDTSLFTRARPIDKQTRKYIEMVYKIDEIYYEIQGWATVSQYDKKREIRNFQQDYGNSGILYLFFIRGMDLKKINMESSETDQFNASKPDPFESLHKKWNWRGDTTIEVSRDVPADEPQQEQVIVIPQRSFLTTKEKKIIMEQIWDLVLENDDDKDAEIVLQQNDMDTMRKYWPDLNALEKKVYLLKLCMLIGPDLNEMYDMNMIKRYNNLDEMMDDLEMIKTQSCVIL